MNVKSIIDFLILHNVEIIQWLVAAILLIFSGYLGWSLFRKPTESADVESADEIKKALKEVLETTRQVASAAPSASSAGEASSATASSGAASEASAELQAKIEALSKELESAKAGQDELESAQKKLEELEAKLAEYEILEDDIADLSLYREENEKLKKQLAKLQGGAAPEAAEAESNDSLVEEFAAAVDQKAAAPTEEPESEALPEVPEAEEEPAQEASVEEDFVAEFQAAVDVEKKSQQSEAEEEKASAPAPKPAKPEPKAAPAPAEEEESAEVASDDLMAEFEQSLSAEGEEAPAEPAPAEPPPSPEVSASGGLDTEKMLEEMAELAAVVPDEDTSALEEQIDTEKMAAEATKLTSEG